MKIEVLYFDGCPHHRPTVDRVRAVLREEGVQQEVAEVAVADQNAAITLAFLGSPSVRVNGVDIEPEARSSQNFGIMCRTYLGAGLDEGRREGLPPDAMIRLAIREAADRGQEA
jgi:hypothetical protein